MADRKRELEMLLSKSKAREVEEKQLIDDLKTQLEVSTEQSSSLIMTMD